MRRARVGVAAALALALALPCRLELPALPVHAGGVYAIALARRSTVLTGYNADLARHGAFYGSAAYTRPS